MRLDNLYGWVSLQDCWLEVSLHPEGPATGFPWFSSVLEQMLSWYPEFHVVLHASHASPPTGNVKISP
jgi:hypothetical protein